LLQAMRIAVEFDRLAGPLFTDLNLTASDGDKVALIGPNGCGKSSLLRVLFGDLQPQAGHVVSGGRAAFVRQEHFVLSEPEHEGQYRRALSELGLRRPIDWDSASPGEKMRHELACAIATDPAVLLLDEPTNHLDLEAKRWVAQFLRSCRLPIVFATHDRAFADLVATRTMEIERGQVREYGGGYSAAMGEKEAAHRREMAQYEAQKKETRRLKATAEATLQRAADMTKIPRKNVTFGMSAPHYAALQKKLDRRARAIKTRVSQLADRAVEKPFEARSQTIEFSTKPIRGSIALQVRHGCKSFGARCVLRDVSFDLKRGGRLALLGPNGCGKTTLLKCLEDPGWFDSGEVALAPGGQIASLDQERAGFDPDHSLLEGLEGDSDAARVLLGRLGLRGDFPLRLLGQLSVGERSRVAMVKMLLSEANVLLLDEPTNHLDLAALEALEAALNDYPGAVIFTSHDERFIEKVSSDRLELPPRE